MTFLLSLIATAPDQPRWLEALPHQVVGLCVVFTGLALVWLLLEGAGLVFRWMERQEEPPPPPPVPIVPPHPQSVGSPVGPAQLTSGDVPLEVIVVISAAAEAYLGAGIKIVSIGPLDRIPEQHLRLMAWSNEGRRQHFASHKVR